MNVFYKIYARIFQKIMYIGYFLIPSKKQKIFDNYESLLPYIKDRKILIVCSKGMGKHGILVDLTDFLDKNNIKYVSYDEITYNPKIEEIEKGVEISRKANINSIIGLGGGSNLDGAKLINARLANLNIPIEKMKGLFKVKHKLLPLACIPTTAGSGSEATLAAVISSKDHKYPVESFKLIPDFVIFKSEYLLSVPRSVKAYTGIDAFTHALEAYLGKSLTKRSKKESIKAIKLILNNLEKSLDNDIEAIKNMQLASYLAGRAFSRSYVGYVHSFAHAVSSLYNTPHGLAIGICLPYILKAYSSSIYNKISSLVDELNLFNKDDSKKEKTFNFIKLIEDLEKNIDIPSSFKGIIDKKDIPNMAKLSFLESNPLYPVPKIFSKKEMEVIFLKMI